MSFLSEEIISNYDRDGAVCLRNVFSARWIDCVVRGIERNLMLPSSYSEKLKGESGMGFYFNDYCNWTKITEFKEYAFDSPAAEIAGKLTQSKRISFYHEHVLVKEPGTFKETPWHQDQAYYPIDGSKVCSIWMPVDHVPKETSVQFVAGSHKWDWYLPKKFATNSYYESNSHKNADRVYKPVPDIENDRSQYEILYWELEPGDCVVFHMRTLHGAPGNPSEDRSRRVLSTRWLGDDAVMASRPWNVSPPTFGGLKPGDPAISEEFPVVWNETK